jgi:hypothetical protein
VESSLMAESLFVTLVVVVITVAVLRVMLSVGRLWW